MGIELTEDEQWELLESNAIARLATVDSNGLPHVVPLWYVTDRDRGIAFSTPGDTTKVRHLEATPKASLTVDEGESYFQLRAVIAEGTVCRVEEPNRLERRWCQKYFDRNERPAFMEALYEGREWVWFRLEPGRWVSWDNGKIDRERL